MLVEICVQDCVCAVCGYREEKYIARQEDISLVCKRAQRYYMMESNGIEQRPYVNVINELDSVYGQKILHIWKEITNACRVGFMRPPTSFVLPGR